MMVAGVTTTPDVSIMPHKDQMKSSAVLPVANVPFETGTSMLLSKSCATLGTVDWYVMYPVSAAISPVASMPSVRSFPRS